jgi:membrane fusion protein, multidrug efflux system
MKAYQAYPTTCLVLAVLLLAVWCSRLELTRAADDNETPIVTEVAVHVGNIVRTTLHAYVTTYGAVEPEPAYRGKPPAYARIATPVAGIIAAMQCEEGLAVKTGASLFHLDSRNIDAQIEKARVAVEFAQKSLTREQGLLQEENISRKLFEQTEQQLATARRDLASLQTQRNLLTIRAPLSGTIIKVNAKPGEAVDLNAVLAEVMDLDRLVINAAVPSVDIYRVKLGQAVEFSPGRQTGDTGTADTALPVYHGRVAFIGLQVDPKTDTVPVRIAVPRGSGVRPGQFVSVRIVAEQRSGRLAVPLESVVTVAGNTVIAVVEGELARQRRVTLGIRDGDLVEIDGDGLREGMRVVTTGAYGLPEETRVRLLKP